MPMQRLPANIRRSPNLHKDKPTLWLRHLVLSAMHSDSLQQVPFVGAASWLGVDAAGRRTLGGGRRAPRLVGEPRPSPSSFRITLARPRTSTRRRPITAHHPDRDHHRDRARDHHRDRDLVGQRGRHVKEAMTLHCIA